MNVLVPRSLRDQSYDVFSVYEQSRGLDDDAILAKAHSEDRILVTNDKDFGEKIFRERRPHRDVVFLRLQDERPPSKIDAIRKLLDGHADHLRDAFVVVSESQIRFAGG